jgi:hypothetical protein
VANRPPWPAGINIKYVTLRPAESLTLVLRVGMELISGNANQERSSFSGRDAGLMRPGPDRIDITLPEVVDSGLDGR